MALDLFKLLGTIEVDNSKANERISETSKQGATAKDKLESAFEKIGSAFRKMFDGDKSKNVKASFDDLTTTTNKQREKLEDLKTEYKNLYTQHGKNSSEAKRVAKEIEELSEEIDKNEKEMDEASRAADKYDKSLSDVGDSANGAKSKLSSALGAVGKGAAAVGKTVVKGLAVGGAAFAGLTVKALGASGELEQNMSGSEAVFGKYATKMQDTAKNAFSNMGLSTSDYLATANKMGSLFKGAGFTQEEAMNRSAEAMQRAADVASIMGISTEDAMESIAGAAKGNFTMMDNLGVAMNDTALNAYALEKGINKTTQEMTQQEKIGLAMDMFLEKTADYAGNYAKENETLAGSLGTAKAALTNFLDGSGDVDQLVGAFENAANVIIENVETLAPRLISGISSLISKITPKLPGLLNKLLPTVVDGAVSLISGLASALPGLMDVLVTSVIPSLLSGVVTVAETLISALPGLIESICSALPVLLPQLISGITSVIVMLCENFSSIIEPIISELPNIIISVVSAICENLPILIDGLITLVMGIVGAIPQIIQGLVDATPTIIELLITSILSNLPKIIAGLIKVVVQIVRNLPQIFASLIEGVGNVFEGVWAALTNVFGAIGDWMGKNVVKPVVDFFKDLWDSVKSIWEGIKNAIEKAWDAIKNAVSNAINAVKNTVSNVFNGIKTTASNIWNGIKSSITSVWTGIKSGVSKAINSVRDTVSNVFNGIKTSVGNIWNSIKEKITAPIQKARDTIKGIVDKIKGFFTGMKIELPKIKLPHFRVEGKLSISPPSVPKLSIDWYSKAMNNPMVLNDPTIFGYNPATGSFMGGGEAGSEVVSGTNTLMNMIGQAVESRTSGMADRIIALLTALLNAIVGGNEELLQAVLAGHSLKIGEREFGRLVKEYA